VVPGVTRRQAHESQSGSPIGRRHGIHEVAACQQLLMAAGRLSPGSNAVVPADTAAGSAVDYLGRLKATANRASSCLNCPGPGDESVNPLALASIGLPTVAAEHADQPGVATMPTTGAEDEGPLRWRAAIHPWPGTAVITLWRLTGCPANGSFRMIRSPGCPIRHPPGPIIEPCGQLTMHGWRNSRQTSCLAPATLGGAVPSCSGCRWQQKSRTPRQS